MNTAKLISKVIYGTEGWAVAEQFDDTWGNTEEFENQNVNALTKIQALIGDILEENLLSEDSHDELNEYYEDLRGYLFELDHAD